MSQSGLGLELPLVLTKLAAELVKLDKLQVEPGMFGAEAQVKLK